MSKPVASRALRSCYFHLLAPCCQDSPSQNHCHQLTVITNTANIFLMDQHSGHESSHQTQRPQ
uniref:Uncharacterized protein n=1 Tax=Arundo donax TaxID=35708 RepID=A0A0A8YGP3_ARUDO